MNTETQKKIEKAQHLSRAVDDFTSYCGDMEISLYGDCNGFVSYEKLLTLLVENPELGELAKKVYKLVNW